MGPTVQLTDTQLAQFTATGFIVVDGERVSRNFGIPLPADSTEGVSAPPELWRDLADPCSTCDGSGVTPSRGYAPTLDASIGWRPCPNPDCAGGRQVVALTVTCKPCRGMGAARFKNCVPCDASGRTNLGRFTIRLLPVVDGDVVPTEPLPDGLYFTSEQHYSSPRTYNAWIDSLWQSHRYWLDPLPQPGQWAVLFEAVDA